MKNRTIALCMMLALIAGIPSCKKNDAGNPNPPPPPNNPPPTNNTQDTTGPLKSANSFLLGMAVEYSQMSGNATFAATVKREANAVTFGNELKYGSIVGNDGSFNYTTADALYNLCSSAGLQVHGHNLSWYQQNNTNYLAGIVAGAGTGNGPNLVANGDFETTGGGLFANWTVFNPAGNTGGNGSFSVGTGAANVHSGANSLQATVTTGGTNYLVQLSGTGFTTIAGHKYTVAFWIRAANAGGSEQVEFQYDAPAGTGAQYSGNMNNTTSWAQASYTFTATGTTARLVFDMGQVANTYYVDGVTVTDITAGAATADPAVVAARVDSVFRLWINTTVTHYAGKIKSWDVVNEPMTDGNGALRTSANASVTPLAAGQFFWSDYLGRQYALKAFQYARAADPAALLFVNEYNLESSSVKLDSLLGYVKELKAAGAPIDGIGTQMHISLSTPPSGIDNAFIKMAATGLKIRVSELDIRINPQNSAGFVPYPADPTLLASQSAMYKYVVSSYLKNVPAGQRYGITVWGVDDPESWIITSQGQQDAPLLFDKNFAKKPAYSGFLQGLKGN